MPPIGLMLGNVDFTNLFVVLKQGTKALGPYTSLAEAHAAGAVTLNYGQFINNIVSFVIVAFAVFMLVRTMNRLQERLEHHPEVTPTTKECPLCCSVINMKATRCPQCTADL